MDSTFIALASAGCIFLGALLSLWLQRLLPGHHLSKERQDVVKLSAGTIATLTALVLHQEGRICLMYPMFSKVNSPDKAGEVQLHERGNSNQLVPIVNSSLARFTGLPPMSADDGKNFQR